jgi:hypothetical protein
MTFTAEQRKQINTNNQKIIEYIENNILPHITYSYETGSFGPEETWGRWDENRGKRYHIALNGPYADKIRFYHANVPYNAEELIDKPEYAVNFIKYWQDAKSYMNTEINNQKDTIKAIYDFQI